ncbi:MAG: M48 family metallopeptidase [bacterium]|nr:peptidase [Deltaproteobacteria bacterium]MCP4905256.1 M48 family metallopeptidase [bacterium]
MSHNRLLISLVFLATASIGVGCATSPTGRSQLILHSADQMAQMGTSAFTEMKSKTPRSSNSSQTALVRCVANSITSILTPADTRSVSVGQWEVELFDDPTANAFALPGGKMGVHTGLLDVATTPAQLAAVMGHEVAHVLARHGNERISQSTSAQVVMGAVAVMAGADTPARQQAMAALGLGVQYGILMPFGRGQESEADIVGLGLMARAGFDPRQSVTLWQNMARASSGQAPPEFMSTHPSNQTRISDLRAAMPQAIVLYDRAVSTGHRANCQRILK